jgi:hypothetical protein
VANTWARRQSEDAATTFATGLAVRLIGLAKGRYRRPGGLGEAFPRSGSSARLIRSLYCDRPPDQTHASASLSPQRRTGALETWDAIRARRNVRRYTDRSIAGEDLERVLEAGRRAPSASNWQPWNFVVVSDHAQLTELAKVWRGAGHIARSAATVALVAQEPEDARHRGLLMYDLGQVTAIMMLGAADLGIGSCHADVGDQEQARVGVS